MWPFKRKKTLIAIATADLTVSSLLYEGLSRETLHLYFYVDSKGRRSFKFSDKFSVGKQEMIGKAQVWKETGILPSWAIKIEDYEG